MPNLTIRITGLEELVRRLNSPTLLGPTLRQAFTNSILLIQRDAQRNMPVRFGRARASVTHEVDSRPVPLWAKTGTNVDYVKHLEYGTKPHDIYPRNKQALAFTPVAAMNIQGRKSLYRTAKGGLTRTQSKGARVVVRHVRHPGTRAYEMFGRAFKDNLGKVQRFFDQAMQSLVDQWGR